MTTWTFGKLNNYIYGFLKRPCRTTYTWNPSMCRAPSEEKNVVSHVNFSLILRKRHSVYWSYKDDTQMWKPGRFHFSNYTEGVAFELNTWFLHRTNSTPCQTFSPVMWHRHSHIEVHGGKVLSNRTGATSGGNNEKCGHSSQWWGINYSVSQASG